MTNAAKSILPERVTKLRQDLGLSQAQLAEMVGATQQSIDMLERGKVKRPRNLHELARVLRSEVDYLIGAKDVSAVDEVHSPVPLSEERVSYGGKVGAGGFLPVDEYFNQDDDHVVVPPSVVKHSRFPNIAQNVWLCEGNSMDLAGIMDGMWIVAASYMEYVDKVGELDNGQIVIVERTRAGGSEIELTVKEVQFSRGGMRLVPRSSDPRHKEIFVALDAEADNDTETVRILAVVLAATRDYTARARAV